MINYDKVNKVNTNQDQVRICHTPSRLTEKSLKGTDVNELV